MASDEMALPVTVGEKQVGASIEAIRKFLKERTAAVRETSLADQFAHAAD